MLEWVTLSFPCVSPLMYGVAGFLRINNYVGRTSFICRTWTFFEQRYKTIFQLLMYMVRNLCLFARGYQKKGRFNGSVHNSSGARLFDIIAIDV